MFFARRRLPRDRFDQMFSYFKYLVALTYLAIGSIVAFGVWVLGRSLEDVRIAAERSATEQARTKVEESFKQPNIQHMVDEAAQKVIKQSLESTFREQIEKASQLQTDPLIANFVADAIRRAKEGYLIGLTDVQKVLNDPKIDERTKYSTRRIYDNLIRDYEAFAMRQDTSLNALLPELGIQPDTDRRTATARVAAAILDPSPQSFDVSALARGYIALRKLTGINFILFDSKAVERWQRLNSTRLAK